jgi:methyl-galactoside transport system substrate-binding protein
MKRAPIAISCLALSAALCLGLLGCDQSGGKPRIGVALFSVDDSFVGAARRALEAESTGKAVLSVLDGQNQQRIQDEQVDALLLDKAKAIIVNPVDLSVVTSLVFKAKAADVPVVFFSRDPSTVAINMWDKAYFVGVKTEEADALQVQILADYWKTHPEADKDQDGRIEYVLVRGDSDHEAALVSAANRQKAFDAAGLKAVKLTEVSADWTRVEAQQKMASVIATFGAKRIEAVLCANDEMALGAIEALKVAGYFKANGGDFVPVVGVDGTRFALDAIADGSLLGTVRGDAASQGRAAFDLAYALATGKDPGAAGWALSDSKYAFVPRQKVTRENLKEFQSQ